MRQIAMIGLAGLVGAALTFTACKTVQPSPRTEDAVTATDIVDTTANTTTIWDTTASDTIHFIQFSCKDHPCISHHGVVRSYHPRGTAAIVEIVKQFGGKLVGTSGLIYVTPSGNVVAVHDTDGWCCIQPIPGDAIPMDEFGMSVRSAVLTKDPVACEDMFK